MMNANKGEMRNNVVRMMNDEKGYYLEGHRLVLQVTPHHALRPGGEVGGTFELMPVLKELAIRARQNGDHSDH